MTTGERLHELEVYREFKATPEDVKWLIEQLRRCRSALRLTRMMIKDPGPLGPAVLLRAIDGLADLALKEEP